jgi:hypothetical protein
MPVAVHRDADGKCYAQWGKSGKKYYYECGNPKACAEARAKAAKQGRAAYSTGYKG